MATSKLAAITKKFGQSRYSYLKPAQRLARGDWPWEKGVRSRLPEHYKRRYIELYTVAPTPVHWHPKTDKWKVDEFGVRTRVDNVPIPAIFPPVAKKGLWGGEGFMQAFTRKNGDDPHHEASQLQPKLWKPWLQKRVFYSEILDKYLAITVTFRTLDLVDQSYGFDNYILKTHEVDLKSKLGMLIRADMIRTLIHKSNYPNDAEKRERIYEKYKQFIVPEEELEWYGLTISEAEEKQSEIERAELNAGTTPLKTEYMQELIEKIKGGDYYDIYETRFEKKGIIGTLKTKLTSKKSKESAEETDQK